MLSDAELLRLYASEKSEAAFAELVQRYLDLVYSSALRQMSGDTHRAHDVSQVVFTTLARKAGMLASHPVLAGWLYTATQHAAAKAIRVEVRRQARERAAQLMPEIPSNDEPGVDWEQVRPVLDAAMRELPDRDREAVLLRFFAHRPFAEIGAALELSEDAARMRVTRALTRLHGLLARRGVTSTSAALAATLSTQAVIAAPAGIAGSVTTTALATSTGVGVGAGIFELMSTIKTGWGAAGALLLAAAIGTALYQGTRYHSAEETLDARRQQHTTLLATLHREEERVALAERETARLRQELDTLRTTGTLPASAASVPTTSPWDPAREGIAFLERHPAVKQALNDYANASLRFRFAPMYRELGLSPEQIDRFQTLRGMSTSMGAPYAEGRDLSLVNGERVVDGQRRPSEAALALFTELGVSNAGQAQKQILGSVAAARLPEFQAQAEARIYAANVASTLYFTDTPLTSSQADTLVQALTTSRSVGQAAQASQFDWDAVLSKVTPTLAPAQLAALSGLHASDLFNRRLNRPKPAAPTPKKGN